MAFSKGRKKGILIISFVYVLIAAFCFLIIYKNPLFIPSLKMVAIISFLQMYLALVAFVLLSIQIFLGAFGDFLFNKFGGGVYKLHFVNGIITYLLIFLHPFLFFILLFVSRKVLDPFFVYSDFCLMCETKNDLYLSLGRFAFWFISAGFLAAVLRNRDWWRKNWKYLHVLNYLAFFFVAFHAWKLGSNIHSLLYLPVYILGVLIVLISLLGKTYLVIRKSKQK